VAFLLLTNLGNIVHSVHDLAVLPHPVENLVAAGQVLPLAHLIHLFDRQLFISCFQTVSQLSPSCFLPDFAALSTFRLFPTIFQLFDASSYCFNAVFRLCYSIFQFIYPDSFPTFIKLFSTCFQGAVFIPVQVLFRFFSSSFNFFN
jgi:hypothetical protein